METPKYEEFLIDAILPELDRGRPNFDKPHTVAVVIKIKRLINEYEKEDGHKPVNKDTLIIAAYAHDWGYADLFKDGVEVQYDSNLKSAKPLHMEIGAKKIKDLLTSDVFSFLDQREKDRIIHLVKNHDKTEDLKDIDEIILMEADTLGALDTTLVTPTFNKDSRIKYLENSVIPNRKPKFQTVWGKMELERLIDNWRQY